ncbi:MAG: hypothetical protein WCS71_05305 [Sphaerochaetaceae bacterium]
MGTEYTAKLIDGNDPHYDIDGGVTYTDTVVIYKDGVRVDSVKVWSGEGPSAYNDAVANAIGSHDFKWIY